MSGVEDMGNGHDREAGHDHSAFQIRRNRNQSERRNYLTFVERTPSPLTEGCPHRHLAVYDGSLEPKSQQMTL